MQEGMNRSNGSSFQSRGPSAGQGRGFEMKPHIGGSSHHPVRTQNVQPPTFRPSGIGTSGVQDYASRGFPSVLTAQGSEGFRPPPPLTVGRHIPPPPPLPPHPGRQSNQLIRRFPQGQQPLHQSNRHAPHFMTHNNFNSRNVLGGSHLPTQHQHAPYPPPLNGNFVGVANIISIPPPPSFRQAQFFQPPSNHIHISNNFPSVPTHHQNEDPRSQVKNISSKDEVHYNQSLQSTSLSYPNNYSTSGGPDSLKTQPTATQQQIDKAWTEHISPSGTTYYYNAILKTSTYDTPEPLKSGEVKVNIETKAVPWKEYADASTGKKYYSNGVTTTWEKPKEFVSLTLIDDMASPDHVKKKKKVNTKIEFESKEEATAAFKALLLGKEIQPTTKWNDVAKLFSLDETWEACENSLTTGERKQALAEYQTKRANDLRANERQEKIRAKEGFMQLLVDKVGEIKGFSAWTSRLADIRDVLAKDDRFHVVTSESNRESLFLDFCEEFKKREERTKRLEKRKAQESFEAFLLEQEENGALTFSSTWTTFNSSLDGKSRNDARFEVSASLSDSDRQLYFADYVIRLQRAEDDKRIRIRGARHRAEEAQREAYLASLHELAEAGKLLPSTRWRTCETLLTSLPSYGDVYDQDRETPREIFEVFMDEWNETYNRERSFLSHLVYPANGEHLVIGPRTSYDDFCKLLLDRGHVTSDDMLRQVKKIVYRSDPISSARLYFEELIIDLNDQIKANLTNVTTLKRRRVDESSEDEGEIVEEGEIEG